MIALTSVNPESPISSASTFRTLLAGAAGQDIPQWGALEGALSAVKLGSGETAFDAGERHPFVYAVRSGLMKLIYVDAEGNEWIKSFAQEGQFFGSATALLMDGKTSFSAAAVGPALLEKLPYETLCRVSETDPALARAMYALMFEFAWRKEQRERDLLTLRGEERYLAFMRDEVALASRLAQKDVARYLGMTPVGLNRIVSRLRTQLRA